MATSTIRPVLIQDGSIDIFGGASAMNVPPSNTKIKRAAEILGETQINVVQKGHIESLFISEIGYGMCDGPISMGR